MTEVVTGMYELFLEWGMYDNAYEILSLSRVDWGFGVTVCIAALADNRRSLVFATDEAISAPYTTSSSKIFKLRWLHRKWVIMFAGDVDCMVPLLRRLKRNFPKTETPSVDEVSEAVTRAYGEELVKVKEDRHLKPNKLDWEKFQRNDPPLFTDHIYEQLKSQLDETRISSDPNQAPVLLVAGFDSSGPGHIFSVDHPGTQFGHDLVGFHAIGTGFYYALTMLHSHSRNTTSNFDPLNIVLYRVAEAKFMAENDSQVGKSTTLIKWEMNDKPYFILERKFKKLWNKGGRPKIPRGIGDKIKKILETDAYALELPEQLPGVRLELGLTDTAIEITQKVKDIMRENSLTLLEFITNKGPY